MKGRSCKYLKYNLYLGSQVQMLDKAVTETEVAEA